MGGCGLRHSVRTSFAAYRVCWIDALPGLLGRSPVHNQVLFHLRRLQALGADEQHDEPLWLVAAEPAGKECSEVGQWNARLLL